MSRPSLPALLVAIAELEPLERVAARFTGVSRTELAEALEAAAKHLEALAALARVPANQAHAATAAHAPGPLFAAPKAEPRPMRAAETSSSVGAARVVHLWTDGASRGNPGPASVGVMLRDPGGAELGTVSVAIGRRTNNYAEYDAVRRGLLAALELGATAAKVHADSELIVRQLLGAYQVKNADLRPLYEAVKGIEARFPGGVRYQHVRREQNREADALANEALDRS